ncbi:dienelactone hydrolase [Mycena sp. CBHHK59/15]|nr:dienelactone hydrolase [Mycena sp. CBHHK59/15]
MSCPDCFRGNVLEGEPTGVISDIDGAYLAKGSGETSQRAIVLLTDIFGLPLKNSKLLADNFALHLGCDVWVPDLFAGHPPATEWQLRMLPEKAGDKISFFDIIKFIFSILPSIPPIFRNRSAVVDPRTISFVKKMQESKKYEKLGAIGYCLGGGIALRIAPAELFQSIVVAHPSPPTDEQVKAIKVPVLWECAEDDMGIKAPRLREIEAIYEGRRGSDDFADYEIKVYKGTAHGFAARPNLAYPEVKDAFEKAFQQAVDWFNKTIPV